MVTLTAPELDALLERLAEFVTRHGGPCYRGWSPETLRDYFLWHLRQSTLAWAVAGREILGLAVAWQTWQAAIAAHENMNPGRVYFNWEHTPHDPTGDAVWLADVVCIHPGATRVLCGALSERFPHWWHLPVFTYRQKAGQIRLHHITRRSLKQFRPRNPEGGNPT